MQTQISTIQTDKAPSAIGPYSQAKVVNGMLYASGQIPLNPATGEVEGSDISTQTEQIMRNISGVLEAAGASFESVVKTTCFLADMTHIAAFNEIYGKYFTSRPARSCVAVRELPKGVLAEVEVIAICG